MKKIILVLLAVVYLLLPFVYPVCADSAPPKFTSDDGMWLLVYGTNYMSVTQYYGTDEHVVMPSIIAGWEPTALATSTFNGNTSIKMVELAPTIRMLNSKVFEGCVKLEKVVLPEKLTAISASAFSGCISLKEMNLPAKLSKIGTSAFMNCTSLRKLVFSKYVNEIDTRAFAGCTSVSEIQFFGWAEIAPHAFEGVTATVYYSGRDWSEEYRKDYGGNLTWVDVNSYEVITEEFWEGNSIVHMYEGQDFSVRINAPIEAIDHVTVSGETPSVEVALAPSDYILEGISASETKFTLKASVWQSLPVDFRGYISLGVGFHFKDGYSTGKMFSLLQRSETEPPATTAPTQPATEATTLPTTEPTEATTVPVTEPTEATTLPTTEPTEATTEPTEQQTVRTQPTTQPTEQTTLPQTQPATTPDAKETTTPTVMPSDPSDSDGDGYVLAIVIVAVLFTAGAAGTVLWTRKNGKK